MTESGMSNFVGVGLEVRGVDPGADEVQREVADDLGRRRHLDQVPEHPVGGGVGVLDLLEAVPQPERDGLLAQVGELPAGDLGERNTANGVSG